MGNSHSNSCKNLSIYSELANAKQCRTSPADIESNKQKIRSEYIKISMILKNSAKLKNIKACDLPKNKILSIIDADNVNDFNDLLTSVDNPRELLNSEFERGPLYGFIFTRYAWKIIDLIINTYPSDIDVGYVITESVYCTLMHQACWNLSFDLIKKLFNIDNNLIFKTNNYGMTPVDILLLNEHDDVRYAEIIQLFCSCDMRKLIYNVTTKEFRYYHDNLCKIIPKKSSIADIIYITYDNRKNKNEAMNKSHITLLNHLFGLLEKQI